MQVNQKYLIYGGVFLAFIFLAAILLHACCIYKMSRDIAEFTVEMRQTNAAMKEMNDRIQQMSGQLEETNKHIDKTTDSMDDLGKSFRRIKVSVF